MAGRLSGIDVSSASIAQARADNRDVDDPRLRRQELSLRRRWLRSGDRNLRAAPRRARRMGAFHERDAARGAARAHLRHRAQSAQSADPPCRCALRIRPRHRLARRRQGAEIDGGRRLARDRHARRSPRAPSKALSATCRSARKTSLLAPPELFLRRSPPLVHHRHVVAVDALPVRQAVEQRYRGRLRREQRRAELVLVEQLEKIAQLG